MERLRQILTRVDGRGYKAYKDIKGVYRFRNFELAIEYVQGDPFAEPSRIRVMVPHKLSWITDEMMSGPSRRIALRDFVTRAFDHAIRKHGFKSRGSGKSGLIEIDRPGQEVLNRSSALLTENGMEVRFRMGLPAAGRRILGREAVNMFFYDLPDIMDNCFNKNHDEHAKNAIRHCKVAEDADFLRSKLSGLGLVAFVAHGAVLPRRSGIDPRPLDKNVLPFGPIPENLTVEVDLPNAGLVSGMGIPKGVTLVVGGGYHGKSTLLNALSMGVYNHVPEDGREIVVTDPSAVMIRAEDGRRVEKCNISPFISNLPYGKDTLRFSTEDASGSTSQAANIIEAVEAGTGLLLMDEDTSANNFLVRDFRMQQLVASEKEPITPFIDRVRQLYDELGISTILVLGGSGDYLDVANLVLQMEAFRPVDVTERARAICKKFPTSRVSEAHGPMNRPSPRVPVPTSFDPSKGRHAEKVRSMATRAILFGKNEIDISLIQQFCDPSQARMAADMLLYASKYHMDGERSLRDAVSRACEDFQEKGFDAFTFGRFGNRALVRSIEVMAAANRLRTLRIR